MARSPLQRIPGVGPSIAQDLEGLGYHRVEELVGQDPEAMYARQCVRQGGHVDRCVLYTFRCAVYFAETDAPDPEFLKWWSWKDAADPPLHRLRHAAGAGPRPAARG